MLNGSFSAKTISAVKSALLVFCIHVSTTAEPTAQSERENSSLKQALSNSDGFMEIAQLTPSDASDNRGDGFGVGAISGDWIAVGAPGDSQVEYSAGAVYLFRRDGSSWVEHAKILPEEGISWGFFGNTIAMNADRLVVGGYSANCLCLAAVYVHDDNGTRRDLSDDRWTLQGRLVVDEPMGHATQIGIAGNRVVLGVGSPGILGFVGQAVIFDHIGDNWIYTDKLVSSDGVPGDAFGLRASISSDGQRVFVGAHLAQSRAGAAYIFRKDHLGWVEEAKLVAGDTAVGDHFGESFSINGTYLAIGAMAKPTGIGSGMV